MTAASGKTRTDTRPADTVRPARAPLPEDFHAHVYYSTAQQADAGRLRRVLARRFDVTLGRWRHEPVGPHPRPMFQIAFGAGVFSTLVPYLMVNHRGLSILIHPLTGDDLADHARHAMWIGPSLQLNLDVFRS